MDDIEETLGRIVRIGIVTNIDTEKRLARVKFEDEDMTSGWLGVLGSFPFIPEMNEPQCTETAEGHNHELVITPWMPKVNDAVLTLFLPVDDGDGYILGRIG